MRIVASILAFAAATVAFAASPASAAEEIHWMADVNGDGAPEPVVLSELPNNTQKLTVKLGRIAYTAAMPHYPGPDAGLMPPRVVDMNDDNRQEIMVTEIVGAHTDHFSLWGFFGSTLKQVRTADQAPLKLYEGGAVATIARYGCEGTGADRQLVSVSAGIVDYDNYIYEGERVTYRVDNSGIAHETSRVSGTGGSNSPLFQADPNACK